MQNIKLMGIVNITDNSYFADSRCLDSNGNIDLNYTDKQIDKHIKNGADIIDIGACSTRPMSIGVGAEEEWRRLSPCLDLIKNNYPNITISIDTYWSEVVKKVYNKIGYFIVNDISAGEDDPNMLKTVGSLKLPYIAMHKRGNPVTMQSLTDYGTDINGELSAVTQNIINYFNEFSIKANENGIENWIIDPGFGFAKTVRQNYQLLNELSEFKKFGKEILIGISRKSMIFKPLESTPQDVLSATSALHLYSLQKGANILRVHDVKEAKEIIKIYQEIMSANS